MRGHPEDDLQIPIAEWLAWVLVPPTFFTHFPAGGGGEARGRRLKRLGLKPGMPDLWIIAERLYCIEMKVPKTGRLSATQIAAHALLRAAGHEVAVCRSHEAVRVQLAAWRIPTRETKPSIERIRRGILSVDSRIAPTVSGPWDWPASDQIGRKRRKTE